MKKTLLWAGIILLAGLIWYLFLKPSDYLVRFEVKTFPGTVNQMVKIWNNALENPGQIEQTSLTSLTQTLKFNDSTHQYQWEISRINDSTSKVRVYASDLEYSLDNKIAIPFSDTDFEKRTRKTLIDFNEKLNEHIDKFKVTVLGQDTIPAIYCAYLSQRTSQLGKAGGMMRDYNYLTGELLKYQLETDGLPVVEVTQWDTEQDSISFNFCFPIKQADSLPDLGEIKYKEIAPRKAIKAIYNGNYIFSDRAWYAIQDYAQKEKLQILNNPVEVFYNNPNTGADELNWKTEVYLPLAD